MKKSTALWTAVIALLILNLSTLSVLFFNRHKKPHRTEPKEIIIKRLRLDEQQQAAYHELIEKHKEDLKTIEEQRKIVKERLYNKLAQTEDRADGNIKSLGRIQEVIEQLHFQHFQQIRQLCRPDQISAYDSLSIDLARMFSSKPRMGRKKGRHSGGDHPRRPKNE